MKRALRPHQALALMLRVAKPRYPLPPMAMTTQHFRARLAFEAREAMALVRKYFPGDRP